MITYLLETPNGTRFTLSVHVPPDQIKNYVNGNYNKGGLGLGLKILGVK